MVVSVQAMDGIGVCAVRAPSAPWASDKSKPLSDALRKRLQEATTGRFHLGDVSLDCAGPSIGSILSMSGELEAEALIAQADAAMYEVERERRQGQPAR